MPCFYPLKGYRWDDGTIRFRRPGVVEAGKLGSGDVGLIEVPCGQCFGCRMRRRQDWAIRCMHENQLHGEVGQFLTLTYDDDNLPKDGSLVKRDFQNFMKRVRKRVGPGLRFFMCGEYGEKNLRPHYHVLFFNYPYEDLVLCEETQYGKLYQSADLLSDWRLGRCVLGAVTLRSASYVARYCLKKVTGEKAESHYAGRLPEYNDMSRRPGIGRDWWTKYRKLESDYVVMDGKRFATPRYYDRLMEEEFPYVMRELKAKRAELGYENVENWMRLKDRDEHARLSCKHYERLRDERSFRNL